MKIRIKERESKKFYDEVLFVTSYYYKILKNHKKRISRMTLEFMKYLLLIGVFLLLTIYLYLDTKDNFYIFVMSVYGIFLIFCIYFIFLSYKRIKEYMVDKDEVTINITQEYIEYRTVSSYFKTNYDDMECVLINKYSICFIPKTNKSALISLGIRYKDEVIRMLKKYKKESLLVNYHEK